MQAQYVILQTAHAKMQGLNGVRIMDWNYFKYIDAIAIVGSLSHAAKLLKIDTSTLSRHLQKLEQDHHVKIFKKSGNKLIITAEGKHWVRCAQFMRSQLDDFSFSQGEKEFAIVVTSLEIFFNHYFIPRVAHFNTKIECIGADRSLDLSRREADIAIRFGKPTSGDYIIQKLFDAGHAIYIGKDFRSKLSNDFKKCPWVSLNDDFSNITDREWLRAHVEEVFIKYKVSSCEQILALLKSVQVLGILPCYMGDAQKNIERFHVGEIIFERAAWLVVHRELSVQTHIRKFIQELKNQIKKDTQLLSGE